jgi:hypothetical protein
VGRFSRRPQRRELISSPGDELVQTLGLCQVFEPMIAEVAGVDVDEVSRHLRARPDRRRPPSGDPRGAVHVHSEVVVADDQRLSGWIPIRTRSGRPRAHAGRLPPPYGRPRFRMREERVALCVHLVARAERLRSLRRCLERLRVLSVPSSTSRRVDCSMSVR